MPGTRLEEEARVLFDPRSRIEQLPFPDDVILDAIGAPSMCAFSLYEKVVLTVTSTLEPCVVLVESGK